MVIYVDTSVLVALLTNEAHSPAVARWYGHTRAQLVSACWCVTEFASALGIKQRTGQISSEQATAVWQQFERLAANDLQLLPVDPAQFYRGATLTLYAKSGLRAGDALHLATAEQAKANSMATLDDVLARNAQQLKIKPVAFA